MTFHSAWYPNILLTCLLLIHKYCFSRVGQSVRHANIRKEDLHLNHTLNKVNYYYLKFVSPELASFFSTIFVEARRRMKGESNEEM